MIPLVVGAGMHSFDGVADLVLDSVWGKRHATPLLGGASSSRLEVALFEIEHSPCLDVLTELTSLWVAERLVKIGACAARLFGATPCVRRHNNVLVPIGRPRPRVVAFGDLGAVPVDAAVAPFAANLLAADYDLTGAMRVGELNWAYFADVDDLRRLVELSVSFGAAPHRWHTSLKVMPDRQLAASAGIVDAELPPVAEAVRSYAEAVMSQDSFGRDAVDLPRVVD